MVNEMMFNENINESIINELQKLLDGKTYNQGVINHIRVTRVTYRAGPAHVIRGSPVIWSRDQARIDHLSPRLHRAVCF